MLGIIEWGVSTVWKILCYSFMIGIFVVSIKYGRTAIKELMETVITSIRFAAFRLRNNLNAKMEEPKEES